jgi:hypothetical protein
VFGWITVAYWLSKAVFPQPIWPLVPLPTFDGLLSEIAPWIREQVPGLSRPDEEVVARLNREVLRVLALDWLIIATGVASGALLIRRRRAGRGIAVALCAGLLLWMAVAQARLVSEGHFADRWAAMARVAPKLAIADAIQVLFLASTLVYLPRRQVRAAFDADPGSPTAT